MTFVSYAPNSEDVMLWRAFRDLPFGFYVDFGALHPDGGSLTRAFYDRGWQGINVSAEASVQRRLADTRLRDVSLVVGPSLASVLDAHGRAEIHFLRVSAGGAEDEVLRGMDFRRYRPWIVLVADRAAETDGLLREAGYVFVWFDGVNRFFVAEERAEALVRHFRVPPNMYDDSLRAADTEWAERVARAEAQAAGLMDRARAAEIRARHDTAELMEARVLNAHRIQQIRALEEGLVAAQLRVEAEAARSQEAHAWLDAVRGSTSWRVTGPVRVAMRRLVGRGTTADAPVPDSQALPPLAVSAPPESRLRVRPRVEDRVGVLGAAVRSVHQFHPGSAKGDAVTNAMLLIQRVLRGLGYASEIYCMQPDPELVTESGAPALLHADALPLHGDYVLLAHFSLGFDGLDDILKLPARKVLMYHNITPPELLADSAILQHYAGLGRAQLPQWREHVVAALAVSEFNALDLRGYGFPVASACPLLFDVDEMRALAAPTRRVETGVFTVLFVGRLVQSKAQDDLVEAFAAFRAGYGRPCRLVLVGRSQATADLFVGRLLARIGALGLPDDVEITGFLDDAGLRQAYRDADLYVSLSQHEGFGVPLVEAMAHDLPVLAWPCGAVPYTLDDGQEGGVEDQLLRDRAPEAVAARMIRLANDPGARNAIARRQARRLDRFRLEHHVPRLLQALALAGAAPPADAGAAVQLGRNVQFTVTGHVNGSYSLAAVNRGLARAIEAVMPGRVRLVPVEGQPTLDLSGVPDSERVMAERLVVRPRAASGPSVVISQHYPVFVPEDSEDAALALFFWEESVVPLATVRVLNAAFRGVLAPSGFVAKVLVDSGVRVPVHVVGQAPDLSAFRGLGETRSGPGPVMTFLHVSSCLPRKGVDLLLSAFAQAFRADDPVRLVIKGYPNPHNEVAEQLAVIAADPDAPKIEFINRDLEPAAFLALYRTADVMVLPSRGEGFNLPAAEAMAARIPLIVTGFGGHSDFCDASTARLLESRFAPSASHLASGGSLWVEPSVDDLVAALREAFAGRGSPAVAARVAAAAVRVAETLSAEALVGRLVRAAVACVLAPPEPLRRLAWISTWDVRCGVAEYSRHLLEAWPGGPSSGLVVIADDRLSAAEAGAGVRVGWRLGGEENARNLALIVAQEDPQVVVIQHQPGLLAWPDLARLLEDPAMAGRTITVTLHNTGHLDGIGVSDRMRATRALGRVARVIVHTIADLERLKAYGLGANVVMMPHGVPWPNGPAAALRALPPDVSPIVGCYGFLLPGKGIVPLIAAAAILRRRWPGLRLRLVNALYGTPESDAEMVLCRRTADELGLAGAIDWHTDFLPEAHSRALLAGCDLVVLPYQGSLEASSAALRSVLSCQVAVAVTPLAVFDDAGSAVVRLGGVDPSSIAAGVAALLGDVDLRQAAQSAAAAWSAAHAWPDVAERMAGMLQGLMVSPKP